MTKLRLVKNSYVLIDNFYTDISLIKNTVNMRCSFRIDLGTPCGIEQLSYMSRKTILNIIHKRRIWPTKATLEYNSPHDRN